MRSSTIVLAALSALAIAAPLQKRAYVTDVVIDYVTVTVTDGQPLPTRSSTTSSTTSTTSIEVPTTTPEPVIPETTPPPVVVETPTPVVIVETPTPQPVVVQTTPEAVAPVAVAASTQVAVAPAPVVETTEQAAPAPSPVGNDYNSAVLYHHNAHRANHTASDLTYDDTLASYAAEVASKCVFAHDRSPGGGGYGQNIAQSGSTGDEKSGGPNGPVARHISNQWYNGEVNLFTSYGQENPDMSNFENWGHFSQIVWKSTGKVGCATQFCDSNTPMFSGGFSGWFTVCNYGGPGNMGGAYASNIGTPIGLSAVIPN